ncbi:putative ATP-dependent RNA helicase kurz [Blattella germanica]|nr:putative ATP-dependent RNA helicase kurz [Blattella germanica]
MNSEKHVFFDPVWKLHEEMGKSKKGFNWKAREVVKTDIDDTRTSKGCIIGGFIQSPATARTYESTNIYHQYPDKRSSSEEDDDGNSVILEENNIENGQEKEEEEEKEEIVETNLEQEDVDNSETIIQTTSGPMLCTPIVSVKETVIITVSDCEETVDNKDQKKNEDVKMNTKEKDKEVVRKPAVFVAVNRTKEIQEGRLKLPILAEEQTIMETINENPVVVLAGETGSGKTTQVPQFLYEAGYARDGKIIGVTEPRRVAAISMSKRVAEEMNLSTKEISYLIRFEGNATDETQVKFMTDGVLLKEIQSDFLLTKYSVIILDEAHERSVYTDILIGLLSRIVPLRNKRNNPLRLIIMSATLRLEDFTENPRLFKVTPPVIKVESRQFPVTIHFNKRTATEYVAEAFSKACKIHTQLPEGGILIFLTGQQEVNTLVRKLRRAFPFQKKKKESGKNEKHPENKDNGNETKCSDEDKISSADEEEMEMDMQKAIQNARAAKKKQDKVITLPDINLDNYSIMPGDDTELDLLGADDDDLGEIESDEEADQLNLGGLSSSQPMWVLPLYSLLPSYKQAQTSLTIPNVKYVIDSGRVKTRLYDKVTGVSAFTVTWCSKAAANQRAGRAGQMQRKPVDDLLLQMKAMNIDKVVNFPFPSPPDLQQLMSAERRLVLLGALEEPKKKDEYTSKVTPLGYAIAAFPVAPRFGKMLALSHQQDLLPYTVCMVAALSVQEVLLEVPIQNVQEENQNPKQTRAKWIQTRRQWAGVGNSLLLGDPMVLLRAVGAAEYSDRQGKLLSFCADNGLRHKAVVEIRKLRLQLTNEVNLNLPELNLCVDPQMRPPTDVQSKLLRQILLAGMPDQVAHKVSASEIKENEDKAKWQHAYRCAEMEDPVFMHSSSVLRKTSPEWVVYQEVFETSKLYMRGVTAIEPEWLPIYAPALCNLSSPLADPPPRFDEVTGRMYCHVDGTFGRAAWQLPTMEIEFPSSLDKYKWFACFLLQGCVFPKLKKYVSSLLSVPMTMIKTWAKLQPRTEILLNELLAEKVDSKQKLLDAWKKNSTLRNDDDFLEEETADVFISFPPEVQSAIEQVLPSNDPLDHPDFNAVDYINSLFPTEQSLSNIDDVDGRAALEEAQKVIRQLFVHIADIKAKAEQSEEMVKEITRDIKQLDCAKRNLTAAITTLNHLHMLVGGVDTVMEVMKHFHNYMDIPQIKQLADQVNQIHLELAQQITADFHEAFSGPNAKHFAPNKQLAEACLVVSVLDPKLAEYCHLFQENQDTAWLDKIDRRYAWLKRHLMEFEDKFGPMFPPGWEVSERITVEFCHITRSELSKLMSKRKNEIDVKLLLYAIQRTSNFENLLSRRFTGVTIEETHENVAPTERKRTQSQSTNPFETSEPAVQSTNPFEEDMEKTDDPSASQTIVKPKASPFNGIIGKCFEPYLYIYIESLDRFVQDAKQQNQHTSTAASIPAEGSGVVLSSCADLFVFYKKCMVQCTQLSTGQPMLGLAATFQRYLREYAVKLLQNNLPKIAAPGSLGSSMSSITRDLRDLSTSGFIQNFHSLLKEGEVTRYTREEQARVCSILTTSEYCLETTQQLEEKLKEKVNPQLADKINLSQEQDMFHNSQIVMAPTDPAQAFADQFAKLLPEADLSEFQKVLDMKGLRRSDQSYLVDLFRSQQPAQAPTGAGAAATGGPVPFSVSLSSPEHESSRIKKLEKLIKKRL